MTARAELEAETLLRIVLVLVVVWFALVILDLVTDLLLGILELVMPVVGLAIIVLIVLWLLDRI